MTFPASSLGKVVVPLSHIHIKEYQVFLFHQLSHARSRWSLEYKCWGSECCGLWAIGNRRGAMGNRDMREKRETNEVQHDQALRQRLSSLSCLRVFRQDLQDVFVFFSFRMKLKKQSACGGGEKSSPCSVMQEHQPPRPRVQLRPFGYRGVNGVTDSHH